jgi:hypothetical protein
MLACCTLAGCGIRRQKEHLNLPPNLDGQSRYRRGAEYRYSTSLGLLNAGCCLDFASAENWLSGWELMLKGRMGIL